MGVIVHSSRSDVVAWCHAFSRGAARVTTQRAVIRTAEGVHGNAMSRNSAGWTAICAMCVIVVLLNAWIMLDLTVKPDIVTGES